MRSRIDLTPRRFNAWPDAKGTLPGDDANAARLHSPEDVRARFALCAAVNALGLDIADVIVRPHALVVKLPPSCKADTAFREGFTVTLSETGVPGLEIMLSPQATNGTLAAVLSVVSRLSRVIRAHGGHPDTATALDLVVEVFRTS